MLKIEEGVYRLSSEEMARLTAIRDDYRRVVADGSRGYDLRARMEAEKVAMGLPAEAVTVGPAGGSVYVDGGTRYVYVPQEP